MKLELRHIAPYLPYGLKVLNIVEYTLIGIVPYRPIKRYNGEDEFRLIVKSEDNDMDEFPLDSTIKPILRPLSDLTKEIKSNGGTFVFMSKIKESQHHLFFREDIKNPILSIQYSEMQKLLQWHFDVFGLIEQGLAIDINTLNNA